LTKNGSKTSKKYWANPNNSHKILLETNMES
jgi:hypothetical protein